MRDIALPPGASCVQRHKQDIIAISRRWLATRPRVLHRGRDGILTTPLFVRFPLLQLFVHCLYFDSAKAIVARATASKSRAGLPRKGPFGRRRVAGHISGLCFLRLSPRGRKELPRPLTARTCYPPCSIHDWATAGETFIPYFSAAAIRLAPLDRPG